MIKQLICLLVAAVVASAAETGNGAAPQDSPLSRKEALVALSKVQQDSRLLELHLRCQAFEDKLRSIFATSTSGDKQPGSESAAWLFQQTIDYLAARKLPFGNNQPVLVALRECVDKLPSYKAPVAREVIAGPQQVSPVVERQSANTMTPAGHMEKAHDEFARVKENVKDFGQDLYHKGHSDPSTGEHEHEHKQGHEHEHKQEHEYEHEQESDYEHEHEQEREHQHELAADTSKEQLVKQLDQQADHVHHLVLALKERDELVAAIRHELEFAHDAVAENQARLEAALLQLASCQSGHEQPNELRRNPSFEYQRNSEFDDEEQEDYGDDEGMLVGGKSSDADKKQAKKDKKKKEKDDDKVYDSEEEIARKLQDKMNSSEGPEKRCQKYFMALNHPGKVGKKFIKMLAKLNLPNTVNNDPTYYANLAQHAQLLAKSAHKNARLAAQELNQCLGKHQESAVATAEPSVSVGQNFVAAQSSAFAGHSAPVFLKRYTPTEHPHEVASLGGYEDEGESSSPIVDSDYSDYEEVQEAAHRPLGPNEIPVEFVKGPAGGAQSWSFKRRYTNHLPVGSYPSYPKFSLY